MHLTIDRADTPLGELIVVADEAGVLHAIDWTDHEARMMALLHRHWGAVRLVPGHDPGGLTTRLLAYFAGDRGAIDGLPARTAGTPFQHRVWAALRDVPCGHTVSYLELARRVGSPLAVRAVGRANGANPVGIVVPCHRVVGADGTLTGYGGGVDRKRWLLAHEAGAGAADVWRTREGPAAL